MPQPPDEPLLGPVWPKRHDLGVFGVVTVALDHDLVEAAREQAPFWVRKTPRQLGRVLRELNQRLVVRDRRHGSVVVRVVAGLRLECALRHRFRVVGDRAEGAGVAAGNGLQERRERVLRFLVLVVQPERLTLQRH